MKRKLSLIIATIILISSILSISVSANDNIELFNNNTAATHTAFVINDSGLAIVSVDCLGYEGITTRIEVDIHIEKRNFLFFWENARHEIYVVYVDNYDNEFTYQLEEKGTYRCTVTYTISGTGGEDDVIPYQETASW
ncbi:MAG: hypothetical protein IJW76_00275 [Clostridia bacterium]|nr:hypothetical protein [Clostridia bacterium]